MSQDIFRTKLAGIEQWFKWDSFHAFGPHSTVYSPINIQVFNIQQDEQKTNLCQASKFTVCNIAEVKKKRVELCFVNECCTTQSYF